jgi:hypothetical protein
LSRHDRHSRFCPTRKAKTLITGLTIPELVNDKKMGCSDAYDLWGDAVW